MAYYQNAKDMYTEDFVGTDFYIEEGSNFYNLIFPFYMRISYLTQIADELAKKTNMTDALASGYSKYVEKIADQLGVKRKQGTYAIIPVIIKGKPKTTTKNPIVVGTLDNRLYITENNITLDDNGEWCGNVVAKEAGSAYNVKAGDICNFPVKYVDIISVTNETDYNDAYDKETDQSLADRYYLALQSNQTSGNINHYKAWALEVTGCAYCDVEPLWDKGNGLNGNGSVRLIIANSNKRKASEELIQEVKDHIAKKNDGSGKAPIGCDLTVISYDEVNINISFSVLLDENYSLNQVQPIIEKVLEQHFSDMPINSKIIRIFDIYKAMSNVEGVVDVANIKLNDQEKGIELNKEIPVLGDLLLTEEIL